MIPQKFPYKCLKLIILKSFFVATIVKLNCQARQKEGTQMQIGNSNDRFYFQILCPFRQNDKQLDYENLWVQRTRQNNKSTK